MGVGVIGPDRRTVDRRMLVGRRRRDMPVSDDRRFVLDRRRTPRRDGLAARLARYVG